MTYEQQTPADQAYDKLCDFAAFDDLNPAQFGEVMNLAIAKALDAFDADCVDGEFVDCTDYEAAANAAREEWEAEAYSDHLGRGDYLRDLRDDR